MATRGIDFLKMHRVDYRLIAICEFQNHRRLYYSYVLLYEATKDMKNRKKAFIQEFDKIMDNYRQAVNPNVAAIVIHSDMATRMNTLKNFI